MASERFSGLKAPCGRVGDGEAFRDADEQALVTEDLMFACGCRVTTHEYHDGSIGRRELHHSGRVLVDELLAEWSG